MSTDPLNADVLTKEPVPPRSRPNASRPRARHHRSPTRTDVSPPAPQQSDTVVDLIVLFADELGRRKLEPESDKGEPARIIRVDEDVPRPQPPEPAASAEEQRGFAHVKAWILGGTAVGLVIASALTAEVSLDGSSVAPSSRRLSEPAATLPAFPGPDRRVERRSTPREKAHTRKRSTSPARKRQDRDASTAPARSVRRPRSTAPSPDVRPALPRVVQVPPPTSNSVAPPSASTSEFLP